MNIDNLTESELLSLRDKINFNLTKIKENELIHKVTLKKNKLSQLVTGDKIFGIGIRGKMGHSLVESTDEISSTWRVHIIDYCNVTEFTDRSLRGGEYHRIGISHPKESFGLSTSLSDNEVNRHYILSLSISKNGYDQFYTLIPETWESDIIDAYNNILSFRKKSYDKDISILSDKIDIFIKEKEKINNLIGKDV